MFELFNYEEIPVEIEDISYDGVSINEIHNSSKFSSLQELVWGINNDSILNKKFNDTVKIIFQNDSDKYFENYNPKSFEITLTQSIFTKKDNVLPENPTNFVDFVFQNMNKQQGINYVLTHEMAHAIQHQLFLENKTHLFQRENNLQDEFINLITATNHFRPDKILDTETNFDKKLYDINNAVSQCVTEGFADLYSCYVTYDLYGKDESLKFSKIVSDGRKQYSMDYFNSQVIDKFIDNLKDNENSLKFDNFNDLHKYMSSIISDSALNVLEDKLNGHIDKSLNQDKQRVYNHVFLGSVPHFLDALNYEHNIKSSNDSLSVLLKEPQKAQSFLFNENSHIDSATEHYCFKKGNKIYKDGISTISFLGEKPFQINKTSQSNLIVKKSNFSSNLNNKVELDFSDLSNKSKIEKNIVSKTLLGNIKKTNEQIKNNIKEQPFNKSIKKNDLGL